MKKIFSVLLILVLVFSLSACRNQSDEDPTAPGEPVEPIMILANN